MLRKLKLAPKLALILGSILTAIFVLLILVVTLLSKSAITSTISGELTAVSKSNGSQIQQIFDAAGTVAANMQGYLEKAYRTAASDPAEMVIPTVTEAADLCESAIYGQTLSPLNYDVEQFLTESARNTAVNNPDISGVGAMFEPYRFQDNIKDYAFYVDESNATGDIEPFGSYESYSAEDYYKEASETRQTVVTDPYDYNGIKMVSYAMPILYDNELQGVVMADINIDNFSKVEATSARYPSMSAKIYDNNGKLIYDSVDKGNIGKSMGDFTPDESELQAVTAQMAKGEAFQTSIHDENGKGQIRFFTPLTAGSETWWSVTALSAADMNRSVTRTTWILILISAAALALLIAVTVLVLTRLLKPMEAIVGAAKSISGGNLDVHVSYDSGDEIGLLSHSFDRMAAILKAMVDDVRYLLGEMADGNFHVATRAEDSYVGDFEEIKLSMRKLNRTLSGTLAQINQAADQVSSGSDQVSSGAQALSQGATEQASSVEELAATINMISGQVSDNAHSAQQARLTVDDVNGKISESDQQMREMTSAMDEISASSAQIGKIIKTIEDIAFQTNILALNAAVEAARAGAAGKGFAVVADEVRNLASKSSEASKSTSALIESSLRAVENGTRISTATASSLAAVVEGTREITEQIGQIAASSDDQASSIAQVTQGIDQISSVVQTNSATAEESAAASEELSGQAQMLKDLVGRFRLRPEDGADGGADLTAPRTEAPSGKGDCPHSPLAPGKY